ncbi:hypothetical protein HAX54_043806 [Datura stramonium]|uniref:Uncharacterized protein n=1 Tax=Datura stramonium TaxID=4076 RepID=A0ABS8W3B1_DATST|nr:hypothetical protein [Datura stramonium]
MSTSSSNRDATGDGLSRTVTPTRPAISVSSSFRSHFEIRGATGCRDHCSGGITLCGEIVFRLEAYARGPKITIGSCDGILGAMQVRCGENITAVVDNENQ